MMCEGCENVKWTFLLHLSGGTGCARPYLTREVKHLDAPDDLHNKQLQRMAISAQPQAEDELTDLAAISSSILPHTRL